MSEIEITDYTATGHSGIPYLEGIPFARLRAPISGVYTIMGYDGCEDGRPVVELNFLYPDGSLDWSVSNAVYANLLELTYNNCFSCVNDYPFPQIQLFLGPNCFSSREIPIDLENGAASGFIENVDEQGKQWSISAWNYCCGVSKNGCGPPALCVNSYTDDFLILCEDPQNSLTDVYCYPTMNICFSAFYNNDPTFNTGNDGSNSLILVNGNEYTDFGECITYVNGSNDTPRFYVIEVKNDCEFRYKQVWETHCCSRKENLIVELTGLSDINEICVNKTLTTVSNCFTQTFCPNHPNTGTYTILDESQIKVVVNGLSALNGTYIFPMNCVPYYPALPYPQNFTPEGEVYGGSAPCFQNNNLYKQCVEYYIGQVSILIDQFYKNGEYGNICGCGTEEREYRITETMIGEAYISPVGIYLYPISATYNKYHFGHYCTRDFSSGECGNRNYSDSYSLNIDCTSEDGRCGLILDPNGNLYSPQKCSMGSINWGSACGNQIIDNDNKFSVITSPGSFIKGLYGGINVLIDGVCNGFPALDSNPPDPPVYENACNPCQRGITITRTNLEVCNDNPIYKLRNYNWTSRYI